MKNGKISESILKRSVLKQIHNKREDAILGAAVGADSAAIGVQDAEIVTVATNPLTLDIEDKDLFAKMAICGAINNIYASGAIPVGVSLSVLVPTVSNEAELRELMRSLDKVCESENIQILGGHTQVTRVVKNIVLSVTGIGKAGKNDLSQINKLEPGMDIIATKEIALEGTALLAIEKEAELRTRYSQPFIDKAKAFADRISISEEAKAATSAGGCVMHDVSEGGIFGALWELAQRSGVGLDIDLKKIPIRQETVEICEFFDINPYKLLSGGCLLIGAKDGNRVVREIEKNGGSAVIIGSTNDSNDRVLIQGEERRFLETAQTDELYSIVSE